jgi:Phasin protein
MTMSDNGTLFPNILQPGATLKAFAPMGVKFWKNQETALEGLKEFADGWFARRHKGMQAALEAAQHMVDAESPSDIFQEYQNFFRREMELLAEDGKAYQQQVLRAGANLRAQAEEEQEVLRAAAHASAQPESPQTGKRRTG